MATESETKLALTDATASACDPVAASARVQTRTRDSLPAAGPRVPAPPAEFKPAPPGHFRTVAPRQSELSVLPYALADLARFSSFDEIMGALAPTRAVLTESLTAGARWSAEVQATARWAAYASKMEGEAWHEIRLHFASLRPAFALAKKRNGALAQQAPNLNHLLLVPSVSATASAATKKANAQAEAEGREPTHGKVGKARKRKAEKAALAAATALEREKAGSGQT